MKSAPTLHFVPWSYPQKCFISRNCCLLSLICEQQGLQRSLPAWLLLHYLLWWEAKMLGKIPKHVNPLSLIATTRSQGEWAGGHFSKWHAIITNEVSGLKLWDGTLHPGQHCLLHMISMAHCGTDFHHFSSQACPSLSTEKSQLAGWVRSKELSSALPPEGSRGSLSMGQHSNKRGETDSPSSLEFCYFIFSKFSRI